jgi:hypothetical protein
VFLAKDPAHRLHQQRVPGVPGESGDFPSAFLQDSRGLNHGRLSLASRESPRLFGIGVDSSEVITVGIKDLHEPVMVLAALIVFQTKILGF